ALIEAYGGLGPALLSVGACIAGSFWLMNAHVIVNEHLHNYAKLAIFPVVAVAVIYLMETRRRERQAAREQLLELSTLLESMPEAVFIFDRNARLVDVNRAAEQVCACSREELRGAHVNFLARHMGVYKHAQPEQLSSLAVTRALRGETVPNEARTFSNPADGSVVDALISANPMRGSEGEIIGALLVVRDVTEINQLQRRIADTERHLAIGQMATGIAHDFNNVLNTITQATALLQARPDQSQEQRLYLGMIDNSARRGAEIIKRVREYIRGGSGETALVDVRQLMQDALELTRPLWRGVNNLSVTTQFQPVSPVRANAADLRRVFTNIIVNALQAMPQGGELILHCDEHGGRVYARVQDTGSGIPSEQQKKVFLPYFTTKATGTGLGLSTAQKMLLAQGGNISFQSEPGKGSTFTVELPATEERELGKVA
ncbi:MAG TPA: ATP-binding protein, partial [Terriglobales bacterium]|nr:ATP-binding protein [Terriglobales bacterium]